LHPESIHPHDPHEPERLPSHPRTGKLS
jgi:hypothetical protein